MNFFKNMEVYDNFDMKKIICIILYGVLLFLFLTLIYILAIFIKDTYTIKNDPTLYNGFRIIEKKQITAVDGMTFYTVQVDMNHPKTPYRLYVFASDNKENHLCFVDSYMHKFKPKVNFIMSINGEDYYEIEKYIINHDNGEFSNLSAMSLDAIEVSDKKFDEHIPVVKKLVEQGSWFWLYEGAEFLLKSEEKPYIVEILRNFESVNKEKTEYSEQYYRSTLTYEKMVSKCQELLQKYGGEQ